MSSSATGLSAGSQKLAANINPTSQIIFSRSRLGLIAAGLIASAVSCFTLDNGLVSFLSRGGLPGDLERTILLCEAFAHGGGVILILFVLFSVDKHRRRSLVVVAGCALWSGLAADFIKLFVQRLRPSAMTESGFDAVASFQSFGFTRLSELLAEHAHAQQSFPSAHTATAFGFALGLIWLYRRGTVSLLLIAVLAGIQRIVVSAHWPSDVVAGATVAILVAPIVIAISEKYWCSREPQ